MPKRETDEARRRVRRLLGQGRLELHPQEAGYFSPGRLFPLMALTNSQNDNAPSGFDRAWYGFGCAGRI